MAYKTVQRTNRALWSLVAEQHGVITRAQLVDLGFSAQAITHRLSRGRLYRVRRGIYAVGRPDLSRYGLWMAAVLSCGPDAALSHESAATLWGMRSREGDAIEISMPAQGRSRQPGLVVHRRPTLDAEDVTHDRGIPVTAPTCTLIDLAARLPVDQLERAINEADRLDLTDPERLRSALDEVPRRPGVGILRRTLDRPTFALTDSELERRFLPVARKAGLPRPQTGQLVNGFKVDFYWPDLGLVVETDGLRYHRTPAQQARDRLRDQAHVAAGLTCLRFTRAQVIFDPDHVRATLRAVVGRLRPRRDRRSSG